MSFNRTSYDQCAYKNYLGQSSEPLQYVLDPIKFNHCKPCRHELGLVGGTAVSHVSANLVDLENELRGQTRPLTECPELKHTPKKTKKPMRHLPACQMIPYGPVPPTPQPKLYKCENPE